MRAAALLILLTVAAIAFAVLPPALEFVQRVRKAPETELVCLDPRVAKAMQDAIVRSPHGMSGANTFLEGRLFENSDYRVSTRLKRAIRARIGGLLTGPRRTASAICAIGTGSARRSLPHYALVLGADDLHETDDCRLAALAEGYLTNPRQPEPNSLEGFAARTKACPSR